jgi:hypothetical protein
MSANKEEVVLLRRWNIAIAALAFWVITAPASAQDEPKNLQILTGMRLGDVWHVMNLMADGLGVSCKYCHLEGEGNVASDAKPQKLRAREMMRMVIDLNARNFGGRPVVTCYTCHNGKARPANVPPLPQTIPAPPAPVATKSLPTAAAVIQKYVAAVGREVAPATPRLFKGTSTNATGGKATVTIAETEESLRLDAQLPDGSTLSRAFNATSGWMRDKDGVRDLRPQQLLAVQQARDAYQPFYTSNIGSDARVVDSEKIGERSAWVVATPSARYWFDADTGFLLKRVLYSSSPVGRIPEQIEFDDYRDVGGAKLPFFIRVAGVDPYFNGSRQAQTIEVGVAIAPSQFAKPQS